MGTWSTLTDGVFLGPCVILTNDRRSRAINTGGSLKAVADWTVDRILVQEGASLGAGTVVLPVHPGLSSRELNAIIDAVNKLSSDGRV